MNIDKLSTAQKIILFGVAILEECRITALRNLIVNTHETLNHKFLQSGLKSELIFLEKHNFLRILGGSGVRYMITLSTDDLYKLAQEPALDEIIDDFYLKARAEKFTYHCYSSQLDSFFPALKVAMLTNNVAVTEEIAKKFQHNQETFSHLKERVIYSIFSYNYQYSEKISDKFFVDIFHNIGSYLIFNAQNATLWIERAEKLNPHFFDIDADLIMLYLWTNNRKKLEQHNHILAAAALDMLNGDFDSADSKFTKYINSSKKVNPKEIPHSLIMSAILVGIKSNAANSRLKQHMGLFRNYTNALLDQNQNEYYISLIDNIINHKRYYNNRYDPNYKISTQSNFRLLLWSIFYNLIDPKNMPQEDVKIAIGKIFEFQKRGQFLLANYIYNCLTSLLDNQAEERKLVVELNQKDGIVPLYAPYVKLESWQLALQNISDMQKRFALKTEEPQTKEQLWVWVLSLVKLKNNLWALNSIVPKILTKKKNGEFTTGRVASLTKFADGDFDHLLNSNELMLKSAISYNYYGYELDCDYIKFLVGNDKVYIDSPSNSPIKLTMGSSYIDIKELKNGDMSISLRYSDARDHYRTGEFLHLEEDGSYSIVPFGDEAQELKRIIEKHGENGNLTIPASGIDETLKTLSSLGDNFLIEGANIEQIYSNYPEITGGIDFRMRLNVLPNAIRFELKNYPIPDAKISTVAGYGSPKSTVTIDAQKSLLVRDLNREKKEAKNIVAALPTLQDFSVANFVWEVDEPAAKLQSLAELQDAKIAMEWNDSSHYRISSPKDFSSINWSAKSQSDYLTIGGELTLDDNKVISINALLELFKSRQGEFIPLDDQSFLRLTKELVKQLELLQVAGVVKKDKIELNTASLPMLGTHFDGLMPKAVQKHIERVKGAFAKEYSLPLGFEGELRDYQKIGFQYLSRMAECRIGCCLADDMGLGKTIQLLALLLNEGSHGASLVVAPASVCANWAKEAAKFTPALKVTVLGTQEREEIIKSAKEYDLIICSYGVLAYEIELLSSRKWHTVILDEAQAIKNHTTKRAKAVKSLDAAIKIAATGTPIENNLLELWSLFDFLNPRLLGDEKSFTAKYGKEDAPLMALKRLVSPLILRRIKSEVLDDLPEKTEINLNVELNSDERHLYESLRRTALAELSEDKNANHISIFAHLTKLRRACCHPSLINPELNFMGSKLILLMELVNELRQSGHRALIFSQYVDFLKIVEERFKSENITYQYLDGSTQVAKRQHLVDDFQHGKGEFFLISLKAGGTGLNLTSANYVILADPWWNPAVENQAADRTHRIGQKNPVTVYRLITSSTVEEKILSLHAKKRKLSDDILLDTNKTPLSASELLELFSN